MELPPATLLFRSARQYVYGVLFSLAETQRKMERLAIQRRLPVEGKYCSRMFGVEQKHLRKHIIPVTMEQSLKKCIICQNTYWYEKWINLSLSSLIIKHSE